MGRRTGDGAELAIIELVDNPREKEALEAKKRTKGPSKKKASEAKTKTVAAEKEEESGNEE